MINTQISEYQYDLRGLSSDTKPDSTHYAEEAYGGLGHAPANGSTFFEMDTGDVFIYDIETDFWWTI